MVSQHDGRIQSVQISGESVLISAPERFSPAGKLKAAPEEKPAVLSLFPQNPVLQLPGKPHDMGKEIHRVRGIPGAFAHGLYPAQLFLLPYSVIDGKTVVPFVLRHLSGQSKAGLK